MALLRSLGTALRPLILRGEFSVPLQKFQRLKHKPPPCHESPFPRCMEDNLKSSDCVKAQENVSPFRNLYWNKECCNDPCPDAFPRFDDLYYFISDKAKRVYRQTWVECPEICIRPKVICCGKLIHPPFVKRQKQARPTSSSTDCLFLGGKCPKIKMPCCPPVRDNVKCFAIPPPTECVRICCPYPSYSECDKPQKPPEKPCECKCKEFISICEAYAEWRRKCLYNL